MKRVPRYFDAGEVLFLFRIFIGILDA